MHNLFPENLYHSYIVEGDPDTTIPLLRTLLEERGDIVAHSSDLLCQSYDAFTIDDSRKVKEWHSEKGTDNNKRICIIGTKFINHDAERTLLKIMEEPHASTHFFVVVPNSQMLLDTILSRAHLVKVDKIDNQIFVKDAREFYKSKPKDRIDLVADIIEDHKESVGSGSVRFSAIRLVNDLEKIVYENFKKDNSDSNTKFILGELAKARDYLSLPGASVKMILEHISLVL